MKFSCSRNELQKALNIVRHGASSRNTMQVVEGILFEANGQKLRLTATDLKIGITTEVDIDSQEDGALVINAGLILSVISKMPGEVVYFTSDENNRVVIESEMSEFVINALPAEDFPKFPSADEAKTVKINSGELKEAINGTKFATATNDNMPVITGVKMEVNDDKLRMVAIDGFRLALRDSALNETPGESFEAIVPGKAMNELSNMIASNDEPVEIELSKSQIFFNTPEALFTSRLIDGEFIDYNSIFPKESTTRFVIDKNELLDCCERARLISKQEANNLIRMDIGSGKLEISSNSDQGKFQDVLNIENQGDNLVIAFNSRFFIDALKAINDKEVLVEMTTAVGPAELKPIEGEEFSYLILPVRLSN